MTNDPLWLTGVAGHYASTPDSAALSITGDIDLRCKVAMNDWTPAAAMEVVAKWNSNGNQKSYDLFVDTSGKLGTHHSANGSTTITDLSTVVTGITDGTVKWIRVTRVAASGVVKFYTSDDGSSWNQLGGDVAGTSGAIYDSTTGLEVGTNNAGTNGPASGLFYCVQVLSGINGTAVFDADFTTDNSTNSFAEDSSNHATVTVYGRAQGYEPAWLDPVPLYGQAQHYAYEMRKPIVPATRYPTATGGDVYARR